MKYFIKIILASVIFFMFANEVLSNGLNKNRQGKNEVLFIKDDGISGESQFYTDMAELGYRVDEIAPESVSLNLMDQYKLVVLSAGSNPDACQSSNMRLSLQSFILKSEGKVIIEGGHNGFISAVFPFYLGFRNKVIMIDDWIADNGGSLVISGSHAQSNLANTPNILPASINVNFVNNYYQDVCTNNKFTQLFYGTSNYISKAGILVSPSVDEPQVINYFFYYSALSNRKDAVKLLENSIFNLIGKPVSVNDLSGNIPENYELYQNYPNPFNPETVISYGLPKNSFITLKITDILGSEVETILNENQTAGNHYVRWDARSRSNGIYFYSLSVSGKIIETRKMLLIK
ncbi:MAG TPA: T9SS type A sorting domain-containing protein [Ignavibacteria bacterium]|nr:T9SS type A sorting domain-containing protein [Ignavibacteria bacterium]